MLHLLLSLLKFAIVVFIMVACYVAYKIFYIPYQTRKKYTEYKNVKILDSKTDKIEVADESLPDTHSYDLKMSYLPQAPKSTIPTTPHLLFKITDNLYEFSKIKNLIARFTPDTGYYSMIPTTSFACKSDGNGVKRRHQIIKFLGLSYYSKKIKRAVKSAAKVAQEMDGVKEEDIEKMVLVREYFDRDRIRIFFKISYATLLYGKEFENKIKGCTYFPSQTVDTDRQSKRKINTPSTVDFITSFIETSKDTPSPFSDTLSYCNDENYKQLKKSIFEFLTFEAPDKGSIYNMILSNNRFSPDQVLEDMFCCLYIAFITTTKTISNIIKRLKENEEITNKLKSEINNTFIPKEENKENEAPINLIEHCIYLSKNSSTDFVEKLQSISYLTNVINESLRLDCPIDGTLHFTATEDISYKEVPIPKDSLLRIMFSTFHKDPLEWYEPDSFIPERFDPEHKYFIKPNTENMRGRMSNLAGKQRGINSFIPFSISDRNCPARAMATIQLKLFILLIINKL